MARDRTLSWLHSLNGCIGHLESRVDVDQHDAASSLIDQQNVYAYASAFSKDTATCNAKIQYQHI